MHLELWRTFSGALSAKFFARGSCASGLLFPVCNTLHSFFPNHSKQEFVLATYHSANMLSLSTALADTGMALYKRFGQGSHQIGVSAHIGGLLAGTSFNSIRTHRNIVPGALVD